VSFIIRRNNRRAGERRRPCWNGQHAMRVKGTTADPVGCSIEAAPRMLIGTGLRMGFQEMM
jgi:hypothetical protein